MRYRCLIFLRARRSLRSNACVTCLVVSHRGHRPEFSCFPLFFCPACRGFFLPANSLRMEVLIEVVMSLPLGKYRHYKGAFYHVTGVARHSETQEWLVVYRCLYGDFGLFVRPLEMFTESVTKDGKTVPRFEFIETI